MDFIESLQTAVRYMEENLLEPVTYQEVAKQVYMSAYYFHQTFRIITGMTPADYMRGRRLSKAGEELALSGAKVIDVALKYGYDTPESFAKAFTRFHGVTPSAAKRRGAMLKSFNPLHIKIILEGGKSMDYRIEKRDTFKVLVAKREFDNETMLDAAGKGISDFWTDCKQDGTLDRLVKLTGSTYGIGMCGPMLQDSGTFQYGIGLEYSGAEIPEGCTIWEEKPSLWAVFACMGDDGECISEMWKRIVTEFLPGSEYKRSGESDFELYGPGPEGCFCELWLPVEKK